MSIWRRWMQPMSRRAMTETQGPPLLGLRWACCQAVLDCLHQCIDKRSLSLQKAPQRQRRIKATCWMTIPTSSSCEKRTLALKCYLETKDNKNPVANGIEPQVFPYRASQFSSYNVCRQLQVIQGLLFRDTVDLELPSLNQSLFEIIALSSSAKHFKCRWLWFVWYLFSFHWPFQHGLSCQHWNMAGHCDIF